MKKFISKLFLSAFLIGISPLVFGQYTEVINSNNPGFSESPYSVGSGVYQFESNFFFRNTDIVPKFSQPQSLGAELMFRTSFLSEKLEFNAHFSFQRDEIAFRNVFTSRRYESGIGRFTVAAKYLLYKQEYDDKTKEIRSWNRRNAFDKKRLIPSVAVYAGLNTDFVSEIHQRNGMSPRVGLLLQNDFSNQFNLITNVFYDYIGTDFSEISYIITATISISDRWSTFFENQSVFQENQNNVNYGTGLAFLYNRDLQLNASLRYLQEGRAKGAYTSFGISYRINKHKDDFYEVDEYGNRIEDSPITKYNKKKGGFFSRIFNIFKKKDKKKNRKRRKRN
jgi:hypothetical protein